MFNTMTAAIFQDHSHESSLFDMHANVTRVAFILEKFIEKRTRIEWVIFTINLIFSSTFLTIFGIALIINRDLRRIVLLLVTWAIWLIGSTVFLFVRLSIGTYHFLRIAGDLFAFIIMKMAAKAVSAFQCAKYSFHKDPRERLLVELENAESFSEWMDIALQLDRLSGAWQWRWTPESDLYEWRGLAKQVARLRSARLNGDTTQLMFLLRLCSSRHFCGISNPFLYSQALSGTKKLLEEFTSEVCLALNLICSRGTEHLKNDSLRMAKNVSSPSLIRSPTSIKCKNDTKNMVLNITEQSKYESEMMNVEAFRESFLKNKIENNSQMYYYVSSVLRQQRNQEPDIEAEETELMSTNRQNKLVQRRLPDHSPFERSISSDDLSPGTSIVESIRTVIQTRKEMKVRDVAVQTKNVGSDDAITVLEEVNWLMQNDSHNSVLKSQLSLLNPSLIEQSTIDCITADATSKLRQKKCLPFSSLRNETTTKLYGTPYKDLPTVELNAFDVNSLRLMNPGKREIFEDSRPLHRPIAIHNNATVGVANRQCSTRTQQSKTVHLSTSPFECDSESEYQLSTDMLTPSGTSPMAHRLLTRRFASVPPHISDLMNYTSSTDQSLRSSFARSSDLKPIEDIFRFLITLRLSFGRTALCLSGGGSLAMYHMGVVRTLIEQKCLPKVISGTSGGSIVAGVLAIYTDQELINEVILPDIAQRYGVRWFPPVSSQLQRFFLRGQMMDGSEFEHTCKAYYKNYTFKDAFLRTSKKLTNIANADRLVSIVVAPASRASGGEALILNHINTPDVFIWSAVTASCSLPGLLPPHELLVRSLDGMPVPYCPSGLKWMDGSITQDIPIKELASLFNVKQFIVSQVNPHHAPFVKNHSSDSPLWMQSLENWLTLDIKNRYAKLAKFNMVPRIFGQNISSFWMLQTFEGHVTITPRASLIDWYRMISQPTILDMEDFMTKGAQRTWPHLQRIIQMLKIEQTLRDCWAELTRTVRARAMLLKESSEGPHLRDRQHVPIFHNSWQPQSSEARTMVESFKGPYMRFAKRRARSASDANTITLET